MVKEREIRVKVDASGLDEALERHDSAVSKALERIEKLEGARDILGRDGRNHIARIRALEGDADRAYHRLDALEAAPGAGDISRGTLLVMSDEIEALKASVEYLKVHHVDGGGHDAVPGNLHGRLTWLEERMDSIPPFPTDICEKIEALEALAIGEISEDSVRFPPPSPPTRPVPEKAQPERPEPPAPKDTRDGRLPDPSVRAPFFEIRGRVRCKLCRAKGWNPGTGPFPLVMSVRDRHVLSVGPFAICDRCLSTLEAAGVGG